MDGLQRIPLEGSLSLTNEGTLEIFFLGVGTAFSIADGHTNFFIVKGDDHLLVDFGASGPQRLQSIAGITPGAIRNIFPTHAHADHIAGLEALTVYNRYRSVLPHNGPKLRMVITPEFRTQLWNMTLKGGLGFNEEGMSGEESIFDEYYDVVTPERVEHTGRADTWKASVGSISIELIRTVHVQGGVGANGEEFYSYGLLIDDTIYYSGDTRFDPETTIRYGTNAQLIIHDAGVVSTPLHPTIDQLSTLPESIRQKMLLVHYPPEAHETDTSQFLGLAETGVRYLLS